MTKKQAQIAQQDNTMTQIDKQQKPSRTPLPVNHAKSPRTRTNKYREKDRKVKNIVRLVGGIAAAVVLVLVFGAILFDLFVPNSHRQKPRIPTSFVIQQNLTKESIIASVVDSFQTIFPADSNHSFAAGIGEEFKNRGIHKRHPIIFVPGFVSTGLDVWQAHPCAGKLLRHRLWVNPLLTPGFLKDPRCFLTLMSLNHSTGLDPAHSKLRPAEGFAAADYVAPGYWLWAPLIDNLLELGYDTNSMAMMPYDWRISFPHLEERDGYFTKLKNTIELFHKINKRKVVLMSHSLGSVVAYYFLQWVTHDPAGGGPLWVEEHLHASIGVGPSYLGAPKALSVTLSCECKDTAIFGHMDWHVWKSINLLLPPSERLALWRSWPGGHALIPRGGNLVWGNRTHAPDDLLFQPRNTSYGAAFRIRTATAVLDPKDGSVSTVTDIKELTMDDVLVLLRNQSAESFKLADKFYSYGAKAEDFSDDEHTKDVRYWSSPLESQLPNAPSHTMYSLYGVGLPTERGFHYEFNQLRQDDDDEDTLPYLLDAYVNGHHIANGVHTSDGDATVPLISLGYMGWSAWRHKRFNPHGVKQVVKEYEHRPQSWALRGGPGTGDHVDILGNHELISDILKIVTGANSEDPPQAVLDAIEGSNAFANAVFQDYHVRDRIVSKLAEISTEIDTNLNLGLPDLTCH